MGELYKKYIFLYFMSVWREKIGEDSNREIGMFRFRLFIYRKFSYSFLKLCVCMMCK